ncbi:MAG TPA: hypothetical protein VKP61_16845 [Candidatus Acidoferrum sp.]|nr:hypothetical protein [Candidatus Acidoferrum sp.]
MTSQIGLPLESLSRRVICALNLTNQTLLFHSRSLLRSHALAHRSLRRKPFRITSLADRHPLTSIEPVNQLLGNLVIQFARKRIERRDALALAYICQLLLNNLTPLKKELRGLDVPADPEAEARAFLVDIRSIMGDLAAARGRYDLDPSPVSPPDHAALPQTQPEPPRDYSSIRT